MSDYFDINNLAVLSEEKYHKVPSNLTRDQRKEWAKTMTTGFEKVGKYDVTELHKTAQEFYAQKFDTPINDVYILQHLGSGTLCVYCGKYLVDSFTPYKRKTHKAFKN